MHLDADVNRVFVIKKLMIKRSVLGENDWIQNDVRNALLLNNNTGEPLSCDPSFTRVFIERQN